MKALTKLNTEVIELRFKRLQPSAFAPAPHSATNVFRLRAAAEATIPAHGRKLVSTALSIELPPGSYAQILPQESLLLAHFIDVGAGVIDSDYRGEVKVLLVNHGANDFGVQAGDEVAEMAVLLCPQVQVAEVEQLGESIRAEKGFGSSGLQ